MRGILKRRKPDQKPQQEAGAAAELLTSRLNVEFTHSANSDHGPTMLQTLF